MYAGLEYRKNQTAKAEMTTVGIEIVRSIIVMLMIAKMTPTIPSTESVKAKNKLLSIVPKSFDSLLRITPEGVLSK